MNTIEQFNKFVITNYARTPLVITRAEGSRVWDNEGRCYLDFVQGIATNCVGHCHPDWVKAVSEQAGKLVHISNLYYNENQGQLAERIAQKAGPGKVLFCNSGAEANEGMLKLSRLYGASISGGKEGVRYKVVSADNAFHGRTFGAMAATPQEKIQKGFAPMLPGFATAKFNDLTSFEEAVDDSTAAVLVETIQGESGIKPATVEFLQGLRKLCSERGALLLIDEIQCGYARTGKFFAFDHYGIKADAVSMAKGIAGGFPMGAFWVAEPYADLITPGSHGTTFGGNPLACAAANAVLDIIENENLADNAAHMGDLLAAGLKDLVARYPDKLDGVRGRGLHAALISVKHNMDLVNHFRANGLLTVPGGNGAIRLLPALNVTQDEIYQALDIIGRTLSSAKLA